MLYRCNAVAPLALRPSRPRREPLFVEKHRTDRRPSKQKTNENMSILSHSSVGVDDVAISAAFYDACLSTLGVKRMMQVSGDGSQPAVGDGDDADLVAVAYGRYYPQFWINKPLDEKPPSVPQCVGAIHGNPICVFQRLDPWEGKPSGPNMLFRGLLPGNNPWGPNFRNPIDVAIRMVSNSCL